jgi:adapter protein MecA 1/2
MKFEKLNENKIRITLNTQDLAEKNIDFHSFMSNSKESQNLFISMLDEAEKKVGFVTKDYKIRIEAFAISDGDFIITITRFNKTSDTENKVQPSKSRQVRIKRKTLDYNSNQLIYRFDSFEDFCEFSNFISKTKNFSNIAKKNVLYFYRNTYYLSFSNIVADYEKTKQLNTLLTEFGTYVDNSDLFIQKLTECGKIIIKNNAIKMCINYFGPKVSKK